MPAQRADAKHGVHLRAAGRETRAHGSCFREPPPSQSLLTGCTVRSIVEPKRPVDRTAPTGLKNVTRFK
jgi:hypothetical protein